MEPINLNKQNLRKLKPYLIDDNIINCDANFYYNKSNPNLLYKIFRTNDYLVLRQKQDLIEDLINHEQDINIKELILPQSIININGSFKGITMEKVKGGNISLFLSNNGCPLKIKIDILYELGNLLKKIRNTNPKLNLAFGDVHGDNFMSSKNHISGIDTDGMTINGHRGRISYYLRKNPWLKEINKYEFDHDYIFPNKDTDLFCFIMMVLDIISNDKIYLLSLDEYKRYLEYLYTLDFNPNLLGSLASIYNPNIHNLDPSNYLNTINSTEKSSYSYFKSINR